MNRKGSLGLGISLDLTRLAIARCPLRKCILIKSLLQVYWCQDGGSLLMGILVTPRDAGNWCAFKVTVRYPGADLGGELQHMGCGTHVGDLSSWLSERWLDPALPASAFHVCNEY